jgi:hypothetical protein
MKEKKVHSARAGFGEIGVRDAEALILRRPGEKVGHRLRRFTYTWRPPKAFKKQLPPGFELPLQCVIDSDGLRRFYPSNSFQLFLELASTGGLAVLVQKQGLGKHERHSYRAMRLLFLHVHRMREHFRHRFDSSRDLTVVSSGRTELERKDILPEDLGLDARGQEQRWGVKGLIQRGQALARAANYLKPTVAQGIHYGLVEAARNNPLPVAVKKVPDLIRAALFNVDWADEPNPELFKAITERILTAIHQHLGDDNAAFQKWFLGPKNSFVHQIAKQKRSPGGAIDEREVRRVLLHLGWQAYQFAANCVHAQMRFFQNALGEPLTRRERLYFEHMHLRQQYLGNFPLVLLSPRLGFVKELLWELWDELPDEKLIPVFYQLLDYYGTMAVQRRQADCLVKRGRPASLVESAYRPPAPKSQLFQDLGAEVREVEGVDCGCPQREWWAELRSKPQETMVRILHHCMACDHKKETILTRQRLANIAQALREDD